MLLYPRAMRISLLVLVAACTTHTTQDGAPTLVPDDATRVVVHRQGGTAPHPAGSTCTAMDETFSVDLATGAITYHVCSTAAGNSPYAFQDGQLAPTADATAMIRELIGELPTVIPQCAGDIDDSISVIEPSGTTTYDHVECMQSEMALIQQLESLFDQLGSA